MTDNKENLPAKPVDKLKAVIGSDSIKKQFSNAMGKHSDLFVASIIDIFTSDRGLQKCNPNLIVMECLKAATLKLPINKSLGFAWILPFKNVPTFIIGYKGFIQLAMRTGQYKHINADVVYEGEMVNQDKLSGAIDLSGERKSDEVTGYFAHIETLNGFKKTIYGTVDAMKKYGKEYAPSFNSSHSPWQSDFDSMAIKSLIRQLLGKYGVMSVEMAGTMSRAFEYDDQTPEERLKNDIDNSDGDVIDLDPVVEDKDQPEDTKKTVADTSDGMPVKNF